MAVMTNPADRKARTEEKQRIILRFLRDEIYSTYDVLSELIGTTDPRTIRRTVTNMIRDELLTKETIKTEVRKFDLVGIAMAGQAAAWQADGGDLIDKTYERGRVGMSTLDHTLDLQRIRIRMERAGWEGWRNLDRVAPEMRSNKTVQANSYKRPDALAHSPVLGKVAIECERSWKSKKRIAAVVASHIASMRQNHFDAVVWCCPTPNMAQTFEVILESIEYIQILGQNIKIRDEERERLIVTDYESIHYI